MPHPDLEAERARLRVADDCLVAMRERTEAYVALDSLAANEADSEAVRWQLAQRLKALADDGRALTFGRIDEAGAAGPSGDIHYIGRRHVEDGDGEPVVVDWRAPVAIPFYRATAVDPFGLDRRRRFTFAGVELTDIYEEDFADPESVSAASGVPDPLLAELGRARTGQMRDIVATIQAEQDEVIRAPLEQCLIVQGGPGTGKTAVGLHRAAFLLFEHRARLMRQGVLVVGPNRVFLEYIGQVLPSLGETSVQQTTVDGLLGLRFRVEGTDPIERARVKGDARMASVIEVEAERAIAPVDGDLVVPYRGRSLVIAAERLAEIRETARGRAVPFAEQRIRFRDDVVRELYAVYARGELLGRSPEEFGAELLADRAARSIVDGLWKPVNPTALVKRLLTSRAALARAAEGILDEAEQAALVRKAPRKGEGDGWTRADIALLDEAEALVRGVAREYGHVVVDEAQDLSPMELRAVARRATRASLTVLGDLAQATTPAATTTWTETLHHLGAPEANQLTELTIGYRLPAAILDFANRLLPQAAPHVTPARSAREEGEPPAEHVVDPADVVAHAARIAVERSRLHTTTALVAPAALLADLAVAVAKAGGTTAADDPHATQALSLLPAELAKGLEFDAVVVVEPGAIVAESDHGHRLLFVALTRAVTHLAIVRAAPLPDALRS